MINKIHNIDCNKLMQSMDNDTIDLICTSPPYLNARDYSTYKDLNDYMDTMKSIFKNAHKVLKPNRMCVVVISPVIIPRVNQNKTSKRIPLPFYFVPMMESIGFEFLEDIIWVKPEGAAPNRNGRFFVYRKPVSYKPNIVSEYVLVFRKKSDLPIKFKNESLVKDGYERTNVWHIQTDSKNPHPASYPEKLAENIILYYSYENDIVFDPFSGSGTTCKMAALHHRKYIGCEIHKEYCDMAIERIAEVSEFVLGPYSENF